MKNIELSKTIGERINSALAIRDKKQIDLALHLGMTEKTANTISYFCKGTRTPNVEQLVKISNYLNVSVDYLLGLTDVPTNDTDLQAVCEYIGLSEGAVKNIKNGHHNIESEMFKKNSYSKERKEILSVCLENTSFWALLQDLYNIKHISTRLNDFIHVIYSYEELEINDKFLEEMKKEFGDKWYCLEQDFTDIKAMKYEVLNSANNLIEDFNMIDNKSKFENFFNEYFIYCVKTGDVSNGNDNQENQ